MNKEVLTILEETGAFLTGHFLLSSGKHSAQYVQCAKVFQHPKKAEEAMAGVVLALQGFGITKVVGPAMGGIIVAYELARQLQVEALFTERHEGEMKLRRGFTIEPGEKVLIAEDVITTGKSTKETWQLLEHLGAKVVGVASLVDRRGPGVFEDLPVYSAIHLDFVVHEEGACPLCKEGIPLVKPGSRVAV